MLRQADKKTLFQDLFCIFQRFFSLVLDLSDFYDFLRAFNPFVRFPLLLPSLFSCAHSSKNCMF